MARISRGALVVATAATLFLGACDRSDPPSDEPTPTDTATEADTEPDPPIDEDGSAQAAVELEQPYPAPADATRDFPEALETLTADTGDELSIFGVHRLADDRVVVTGGIVFVDRPNEDFGVGALLEPGYRSVARGFEFAGLELTVPGEETIYLPVRDDEDRCLCSVLRPGYQEGSHRIPVMAVMTAPEQADTVDVTVASFGSFEGLPVTGLPDRPVTPWGRQHTLAITEARRDGGEITARITATSPDDATSSGMGTYSFTERQSCFAGLIATGGGRGTWQEDGCYWSSLPQAGQAVDFEARFPDPGTDEVVFLAWNGFPLTVPIDGEAAEGTADVVRIYAARSTSAGATVTDGQELEVSLDTAVLFDLDESTLTDDAADTLGVAAEALQAQDGRSLTIDGHTDTQGDAAYNMDLSLARAEAVRDALADLLGDGWSFAVNGYGEERTLVDERGTPEEIEAAQARNRRVEITVAS